MAFAKYARSRVVRPDIHLPVWDEVREASQAIGSAFTSREASRIALKEYNPKDYLLSHCSIVASVDVEKGPSPLGQHLESGFTVDRRYLDYYITPETSEFVNNNGDAWSRAVLLSSFRTFIGGENYVEHLQIPEMSKGKIIDAAARDVGKSIYIDILLATNRKHASLISAIKSGQLQTLSMGCNVAHTTCTKCGNVAADETQLCAHIKYAKRQTFFDTLGKKRIIAELCGHIDDEPGSVKFIEASWVANPAFTGAVLRNILSPEEAQVYNRTHGARIQVALNQPARTSDPSLLAKAAFDFGQQQEEFEGAGDADAKKDEESDPMESAISDLADYLRNKAVQKVRQDMSEKNSVPNDVNENLDTNLVREAGQDPSWRKLAIRIHRSTRDFTKTRRLLLGLLLHKSGGWAAVKKAQFSGREVLAISRVLDSLQGVHKVAGESRIYRTVLAVGGAAHYVDADSYLAACSRVLGREPTRTEKAALITKGRLFDLGQ